MAIFLWKSFWNSIPLLFQSLQKKNMFGWFMSEMMLFILCFTKHFMRFFSDPLGTFGRCSLCASLHRVAIHGTKMSWDLWTRNLFVSWQLLLIHLLSNDEHPWWIFWQFLGGWGTTYFVFHCVFGFFSQCVSQIGLEFYRSVLFLFFIYHHRIHHH